MEEMENPEPTCSGSEGSVAGGRGRHRLRKTNSGALAYLLSQDLLAQEERNFGNTQITEGSLEPQDQ